MGGLPEEIEIEFNTWARKAIIDAYLRILTETELSKMPQFKVALPKEGELVPSAEAQPTGLDLTWGLLIVDTVSPDHVSDFLYDLMPTRMKEDFK